MDAFGCRIGFLENRSQEKVKGCESFKRRSTLSRQNITPNRLLSSGSVLKVIHRRTSRRRDILAGCKSFVNNALWACISLLYFQDIIWNYRLRGKLV